jgi:Mor family transcriptional regulator
MIEELITLVGEEAFIKLAGVFGGEKYYVGATEAAVRKLTIVMGSEPAKKMIDAYSGGWIDVPKYTAAAIILRDKQIIQDCDAGLSIRQLARKYELTARHISNVLKKPSGPV